MTRGRSVLYSLLGVAAVGLGLATGAFFMGSARAAVGPLPAEGLALPVDSGVVMGLDVRRFVASPLYTRYASKGFKARPEAFAELEARTGLNPERDVDQIIVGGNHNRESGSAIVFGRFDRTRVQQAIETTHKGKATWKNQNGTTIYLFDEGSRRAGALAFLGDNVLVLGTQGTVEAVTANHTNGGKGLGSNTGFMALVQSVKPGSTFWVVGDGALLSHFNRRIRVPTSEGPGLRPTALGQSGGAADSQPQPIPAPFAGLPPMKSIVITGDLDPVVSFQATGEVADEAAAKNLADVIRGFLALAQMQAAQKPELRELSTAVSVTQDAQRVLIRGRVPYELLDALEPKKLAPPPPKPVTE